MAKQTINIGASPNDGTGTPLRTSFDYCNQNFTELYTATGPSGNNIVVPGSATITGAASAAGLSVTGSTIPTNGVYLPSANSLGFAYNSTLGMTLNSTGLSVGVSPSAWGSNYTPVELTKGAAIWGAKSIPYTIVGANVYNDATNEKYVVSPNTAATKYLQTGGVHSWHIAAAGTAGTAITFTQAMTLDANGNLILKSSNTPATLANNGELTVNATSNTNVRFSYRGSDGVTRVANITLA